MGGYIMYNGELYHYGVKGQKWGIRRYQNKDGSLTPAGKKRYSVTDYELARAFPNEMKTVRQYRKLGDSYRAKAYGTGSIVEGTYVPPKDTSEKSFTKNIRKSDEYYRKARDLQRELESRVRSKKIQSELDTTWINKRKEKLNIKEAQALLEDSYGIRAKAPSGRHMAVNSSRLVIGNQPAHHIVDDMGNVRMSYIRGRSGDRYLASGKEYIDRLDLNQFFIDTNNMNIEYDIYD